MRNRWQYARKDPAKARQDDGKSQLWQTLNDVSDSQINLIATEEVIRRDSNACNQIMRRIYEESKAADHKRAQCQEERTKLRQKLKDSHNKVAELEH